MGQMIVLEILERSNKVKERHKLSEYPITVGRGYDSDIILDDEYVSPHHLKIDHDSDGNLVVFDLNSENGIFLMPKQKRVDKIVLENEVFLKIGHSLLRIRKPEYLVAPTATDKVKAIALKRLINKSWAFALVFFIVGGILLWDSYWNMFTYPKIGRLVVNVLPALVAITVWAGAWAFASRVLVHQASYFAHGVITCIALVGLFILYTLYQFYSFGFDPGISAEILLYVGITIIAVIMFYGHLRLASYRRGRYLATVSVLIVCSMVGLGVFTEYVHSLEYSDELTYPSHLKPIEFKWADSRTSEQFIKTAEKVKSKVDRLAHED